MSELQQLLDRLVAAEAPGAAGWVRAEGRLAPAPVYETFLQCSRALGRRLPLS